MVGALVPPPTASVAPTTRSPAPHVHPTHIFPRIPRLPKSSWLPLAGENKQKAGLGDDVQGEQLQLDPPCHGRQLGSPGPPWFLPHQPPRAALTFSPLGPGKPRSPLEPYRGESSIRGGGGHRADLPPTEGTDLQQGNEVKGGTRLMG